MTHFDALEEDVLNAAGHGSVPHTIVQSMQRTERSIYRAPPGEKAYLGRELMTDVYDLRDWLGSQGFTRLSRRALRDARQLMQEHNVPRPPDRRQMSGGQSANSDWEFTGWL